MSIHAASVSVSPGLWALAWRRLRADRLAMVALAIVIAFLLLMLASVSGLVAGDWSREVGVNYAPPTFLGIQADTLDDKSATTGAHGVADEPPLNPLDPLAADITELRAELRTELRGAGADNRTPIDHYGITDPLTGELNEIHAALKSSTGAASRAALPEERLPTLIFGGDKWGRDVAQKTIKGSGTSIFVGLVAALVATLLGTLLGALAGYFGKWVDDVLNWFYSIFTSIPYLLLILAIAAVVPKGKGLLSIVLILGLTGWTGVFRLVRAE